MVEGRAGLFVFTHPTHAGLLWQWDDDDIVPGIAPRVPLRRPAWIEARFVDTEGRTLLDGTLSVRRPNGMNFRVSVDECRAWGLPGSARDLDPSGPRTWLADGTRRAAVLPHPGLYTARAQVPGRVDVDSPPLALHGPDDVASVQLVLAPGGRVQGRVLRNGEPVVNTLVRARDAGGESVGFARTDALGRYVLKDVPCGELRLELRDPFSHRKHQRRVLVEADRPSVKDFVYTVGVSSLAGRVWWWSAEPAAGVSVVVESADGFSGHVTTSADGSWDLAVPADIRFTVRATANTIVTLADVPAGARDLHIVLAVRDDRAER